MNNTYWFDENDCRHNGIPSWIRGDVSWIRGDVTDIRGDVSNINGNVTDINGDVSRLVGDVSNIKGDVSEISGDVSNIKGDVSWIKGDMTGIRRDLRGDMKNKYVIRKVQYNTDNNEEYADSFELSLNIPCSAFGVYEYRKNDLDWLLYWVKDFDTYHDAYKYVQDMKGLLYSDECKQWF